MQNAKTANMPKENVERAIKKATDKDTSDYKEILFEGYGPYGIAILIETATDNNNRTVASMRNYFTHNGGNMGTSGSVEFMFEKNCHFSIPKGELDLEELEFELIDHGAEDVFEDDENIMIYGSFENFGSLQKELENKEYEILSSGFERIPSNTTKLSEEQEAEVEVLLEKFNEDEDVQNVYHSMG
jgi:YebC/PmpR family DNA-binding regulatory protein